MNIEAKIFKRYNPDFDKLKYYGFKKVKDNFIIEKLFKDNLFKAVVTIDIEGKVSTIVYDIENDDEFLPLRIESNQGTFIGEIRTAYEELLLDIRNKCFLKNYFIFPQSNRIANLITEKYGDKPEFLWEKFEGSAIFRNPETKKWYAIILDVDKSRFEQDKKGIVEVIDIKLEPKEIEKLLKKDGFYPGYHMNKKYWITIILNNIVADEKIMELIQKSHSFTVKKKK